MITIEVIEASQKSNELMLEISPNKASKISSLGVSKAPTAKARANITPTKVSTTKAMRLKSAKDPSMPPEAAIKPAAIKIFNKFASIYFKFFREYDDKIYVPRRKVFPIPAELKLRWARRSKPGRDLSKALYLRSDKPR